jgi:hypothetical protein
MDGRAGQTAKGSLHLFTLVLVLLLVGLLREIVLAGMADVAAPLYLNGPVRLRPVRRRTNPLQRPIFSIW